MAYLTAAELKTYLGISSSSEDSLLTALIAQAQAYIEAQTGRVFEAGADTTRRFDAVSDVIGDEDGRRLTLWLHGYDLCAVTSVTNGDGTTVSSSQYVTEPRGETPYWGLRLKANASVAWTYSETPEDAIVIVGRWAYSTSAPADVVMAARDLAVWLYRRRGQEGASLDAPQVSPSGMMLFPAKVPDTVKMVVEKYQKKVLA